MTTRKATRVGPTRRKEAPPAALRAKVGEALAWLERRGSRTRREEMGSRYGVHTEKAFGVSVADILRLAKVLGPDHDLAAALWKTGWYEARMLATLVEVPARVTAVQMDRWCRDFDNWGLCDTACFYLFDRTPHAFPKVEQWSRSRDEFVKRASMALLACLALHDKAAADASFERCLPLVEAAAEDPRNFVKKAVSWALRAIGERDLELNAAALGLARRLATSEKASAQWVGKDVLRQLASPAVAKRLAARARAKR